MTADHSNGADAQLDATEDPSRDLDQSPPVPDLHVRRRRNVDQDQDSGDRPGQHPTPTAVPPFDFVGLMRRARRNARMSQREMANAIGVAQSAIARAERDGGSVSLSLLLAVLAEGGIDLVAIDGDGEVFTMRPDALRDRARRKLPAHLDAWVASARDQVPEHWKESRRRNSEVHWALRHRAEQPREFLPLYHPAAEDIEIARRRDADNQPIPRYLLRAPSPSPRECACSDECVQLSMACPPTCPCQCEPAPRATG